MPWEAIENQQLPPAWTLPNQAQAWVNPPSWQDTPPAEAAQSPVSWDLVDKYSSLLNRVWEEQIMKMEDDYERIDEMINDEDQLSKMSKEEIVKLYKTHKLLEQEIWKIRPVIEERNKNAINEALKSVTNDWVRQYISEVVKELETPEEVQALLGVVQGVMNAMGGKQADTQPQTGENIKQNISTQWVAPGANQVDPIQGMMSKDPNVRKSAHQWMENLLTQLVGNSR